MKQPYKFPSNIKQDAFQMKDFLGVDFTTHESEVNPKRSPDAVNVISGQTGSMDKRFGTRVEKIYGDRINSIHKVGYAYRRYEEYTWYNESTGSSNLGWRYYNVSKELIIVHAGEGLYLGRIDDNGNYVHIEQIRALTTATNNSMPSLNNYVGNYPSKLIRINQYTYMLTCSGKSVIIDFVRGNNIDGASGSFGIETDATNWTSFDVPYENAPDSTNSESVPGFWAYMLDLRYIPMVQSKFKIPTTYIAKKPDGTQKTQFESKNILTAFVSEHFIGDGTSTIYKLEDSIMTRSVATDTLGFTMPFYNATTDACLRIRIKDASGNWVAYGGTYTLTGFQQVNLSTAPPAPTVLGEDNVEITYMRYVASPFVDSPWTSVRLLSRLTQFEYFGYNGSFDYAFVAYGWDGDFGKLNIDYRIKLDDDLSKVYMDENSFSKLGNSDSAIVGYFRMGNELITMTKKTNGNPTVFVRSASLDEQGEVIFPIRVGVVGVGALSGTSFASLRDDNLWLSEYGVSALITNNVTDTQAVQDRSFYINQKLLSEPNLSNAYAFIFDNKYFLCIEDHIYIADPRSKYAERLAFSESFQYDWYYWEGLSVTAHVVINDTLYFGTLDGRLMSYKNLDDHYPFCDEMPGTRALWETGQDYTKGSFLYNDDGTYICLLNHNSTNRPLEEGKYWHKVFGDTPPTTWSSSSVAYVRDQIVYYNGYYYICVQSHTSYEWINPTNTSYPYWVLFSSNPYKFQIPVLAYWTTPIMNMGNITMRKTLKNLWVRLGKHPNMSVKIYYSTQGVVSEKYDGIFDFSNIDFSRFTFSTDTDPSVMVTNRQERKFMSIQFKVESRDQNPFSLLEIVGKYTINNVFKG